MTDSNKYFKQALSNMTYEVASGAAIRVMADRGLSVKEIAQKLDFPTPLSRVQDEVWKRLLEIEVILESDPEFLDGSSEKVTYVKDYSAFGRTSYRRVVEKVDRPQKEYVACDYGKQRYKDPAAFEKKLALLHPKDRDYVEGLPWPLTTVWHVKDERMQRIMEILESK